MKQYRIALAVGLLIIFVQLSAIDFSFKIAESAYGSFSERVKERVIYFSSVLQKTRYSSASVSQHESIVFTGDVMLGRNVETFMQGEGSDYPYRGLDLVSLAEKPAIVGNFEASMAVPHVQTPAYHMKFSVADEHLSALRDAGFTHLSLANNHSFDYGVEGYENATTQLLTRGFVTFGHGIELTGNSISYLETPQGTIALIAINASASIPTQRDIHSVLNEASEKSDLQIAYIHWGIEYDLVHSKTQKLLAKELVEAGADLIVGHHPHVVQDVDVIDGVIVFYSLGNYIFDQYFSEDVKEGLVLTLDFEERAGVHLIPIESKESLSQPTFMSPEAHGAFLRALAERSHPSLKNVIETGYIPLGDMVATSSKMAIMVR